MKTDVELTIEEMDKALRAYIQRRASETLRKTHSKEELKRLKKLEHSTDEW
jgi:hypothetical protein